MKTTDLMNSRFRNLGFGTKRKSSSPNITHTSSQGSTTSITPTTSNGPLAQTPNPADGSSSTTSLPMNHAPNGLGRPPSYTYNPNAPRATSPMPPGGQQVMPQYLPPLNTGSYSSSGHPAMNNVSQPPQYAGAYNSGPPPSSMAGYPGRGAVEVEGAGRSKAQLIVGIDFVRWLTTFSI